MSASNSPTDPLYWFKNTPKNVRILVQLDTNDLIELPKHYKFRVMNISKEITAFCKITGGAFCEMVGEMDCGTRFFITEEALVQAEMVVDQQP